MSRLVCTLTLLVLVSAACAPAASQPPTVLPTAASSTLSDEALAKELEAYMDQQAANLSFSGAALVARGGKILLQRGYGLADRQSKRPNTEQTRFRIASITKQFTAVAILLLQARGELDVRDRACDYVSDCPPAWADITLHQLLTHTSGIHNLYADPGYTAWQATPAAPAEVMQHYINLPLDFPPGTSWNYSNSGYMVLGQVIERVSRLPYGQFLQENVFTPLGVQDTGFLGTPAVALGYGNSYVLTPADTADPSVDYASGGLYSTVGDLYLWDRALFKDEFLPPDLRAMAVRAYDRMPDSGGLSYGYGFMVGEMRGHRTLGHTGRLEGFSTLNYYFPDDDLTVILLGNQRTAPVTGLSTQLAFMVFDARR